MLVAFVLIGAGFAAAGCMPQRDAGGHIQIVQTRHDNRGFRYRLFDEEYDGAQALKILEDHLQRTPQCRISVVFTDKRSDAAFDAGISRLAERFGASIEFAWPRSSYDGETRIAGGTVDPIR